MKAEYLNPFAEAASFVLKQVIDDNTIARGTLEAKDDPHISRGVSSMVGITGQLRGHVIYDMDKKTALAIASAMNGEPMVGMDNIVRSTINELANMITGHAASKLLALGYRCDITPPTFIVGDRSELYAHKSMKHLIVPLITRCGQLTLSLALVDQA